VLLHCQSRTPSRSAAFKSISCVQLKDQTHRTLPSQSTSAFPKTSVFLISWPYKKHSSMCAQMHEMPLAISIHRVTQILIGQRTSTVMRRKQNSSNQAIKLRDLDKRIITKTRINTIRHLMSPPSSCNKVHETSPF